MTWLYEVENLQLWADARGRMVPHKNGKMAIPEMNIRNYEMMDAIPAKHLENPKFFFLEMEKVFGTR